jgi:hypothetical protein
MWERTAEVIVISALKGGQVVGIRWCDYTAREV